MHGTPLKTFTAIFSAFCLVMIFGKTAFGFRPKPLEGKTSSTNGHRDITFKDSTITDSKSTSKNPVITVTDLSFTTREQVSPTTDSTPISADPVSSSLGAISSTTDPASTTADHAITSTNSINNTKIADSTITDSKSTTIDTVITATGSRSITKNPVITATDASLTTRELVSPTTDSTSIIADPVSISLGAISSTNDPASTTADHAITSTNSINNTKFAGTNEKHTEETTTTRDVIIGSASSGAILILIIASGIIRHVCIKRKKRGTKSKTNNDVQFTNCPINIYVINGGNQKYVESDVRLAEYFPALPSINERLFALPPPTLEEIC